MTGFIILLLFVMMERSSLFKAKPNPNYDVFDEVRYFESAKDVFVHEFKGENLASPFVRIFGTMPTIGNIVIQLTRFRNLLTTGDSFDKHLQVLMHLESVKKNLKCFPF